MFLFFFCLFKEQIKKKDNENKKTKKTKTKTKKNKNKNKKRPFKKKMSEMLRFRCIKIIYLIYLSILFFFSALFISVVLNIIIKKLFPVSVILNSSEIYDAELSGKPYANSFEKSPFNAIFISEMVFRITFITVMCYIFRNLISKIPFFFDGYYNFDHLKVTELSGTLLTVLTFFFQNKLKDEASYLGDNFFTLFAFQN